MRSGKFSRRLRAEQREAERQAEHLEQMLLQHVFTRGAFRRKLPAGLD